MSIHKSNKTDCLRSKWKWYLTIIKKILNSSVFEDRCDVPPLEFGCATQLHSDDDYEQMHDEFESKGI